MGCMTISARHALSVTGSRMPVADLRRGRSDTSPQDVLAATILEAIHAMVAADRGAPAQPLPFSCECRRARRIIVPLSWKAWQAGLSVLNVVATVAQQESGQPRWVAEMRLPRGVTVASGADGDPFSLYQY